jgi:hypothetical protein
MKESMPNRTLKPLSLPEAEQAAKLLGLELADVNTESLRAAFRDRVRELHPDSAAEMPSDVAEKIQHVFQARAKLLVWVAQQPKPGCTVCGGKGYLRTGPFQTQICTSC